MSEETVGTSPAAEAPSAPTGQAAPVSSGTPENTSGQVQGTTAEESFTDPTKLSPELQAHYKAMQGDYTRKMQALAEERENLESEEYDFSGQLDYSRVADLKDSIELRRKWILKYRSK